MPHLPIFHADTPIFRHTFDQACFPLLIDLDILFLDLLSNLHPLLRNGFFLWIARVSTQACTMDNTCKTSSRASTFCRCWSQSRSNAAFRLGPHTSGTDGA